MHHVVHVSHAQHSVAMSSACGCAVSGSVKKMMPPRSSSTICVPTCEPLHSRITRLRYTSVSPTDVCVCVCSICALMHLGVAAERTGRAGGAEHDVWRHDRAQHLHRRRGARQAEIGEDVAVGLDKLLRGEGRASRGGFGYQGYAKGIRRGVLGRYTSTGVWCGS